MNKRIKLSQSEKNPPVRYSEALLRMTESYRKKFTTANAFLRGSRNAWFSANYGAFVANQMALRTDSEKRKNLRALAFQLQRVGIYSSKIPVAEVEHMLLSKVFRYTMDSTTYQPLPTKDSNEMWATFSDNVAGSSYRRGIPYHMAVPEIP